MTQAQQLANLSQAFTAGALGAFRNGFINADFTVSQRGTSATFANTSAYTLDRWTVDTGGGQITWSVTGTPFVNSRSNLLTISQNTLAVGGHAILAQSIEDVRSYANRRITISGWFNAPVGKRYNVGARQYFGSGGSPDVYTGANSALIGTGALTYFSVQMDLPAVATKTLGNGHYLSLYFAEDAFTVHTVQFLEVQVEPGDIATPFERVEPAVQLARCQRYFEIGNIPPVYIAGLSTVAMMFGFTYKATKRTIPTLSFTNVSYYNGGTPTGITSGMSAVANNYDSAALYLSGGTATNIAGLAAGIFRAEADF